MIANDPCLSPQPVLQNKSELQDFDDAVVVPRLSLSDLPLNSVASVHDWEDYSREDRSSTLDDQDLFEFFSQDYFSTPNASTCRQADNIVFCGKLIPCRGSQTEAAEKPQKPLESTADQKKIARWRSIFKWKSSYSFNKSRTTSLKRQRGKSDVTKISNCKTSQVRLPPLEDNGYAMAKLYDGKYVFPVKKVPILAPPTKSRWYLLAFGAGRFPMEMDLSDIKMRQSKNTSQARMFQPENAIEMSNGRRGKSSWSLLRFLGWRSSHAKDAVEASSLGCAPYEMYPRQKPASVVRFSGPRLTV